MHLHACIRNRPHLAGSCKSSPLPNGNFESDKSIEATKLMGWAKLKENS